MISNVPTSPEQRQHINLSQYAYEIIMNDSLTFMGKVNVSGFINMIVKNSGIHHFDDVLLGEESRIESELKEAKIKYSISDKETIEKISKAHLRVHISTNSSFPKEVSLKIRLQKDLHEDLYPLNEDWEGAKYQISQGQFIKAIMEDYARHTFFERESIYFKETIELLETHINAEESKKGILPIILNDETKLYIKPLRISEAYEAPYHYLIGMSSLEADKNYQPSSTRISNIRCVKRSLSSYVSGKLTAKDKKAISLKIKASKVPYIRGETKEFKILLSDSGINMFNSIFHQRPMYDSLKKNSDGTTTMTFTATERQITNYFFQFGKEAYIISPEETRNWVREKYKAALESYDK